MLKPKIEEKKTEEDDEEDDKLHRKMFKRSTAVDDTEIKKKKTELDYIEVRIPKTLSSQMTLKY